MRLTAPVVAPRRRLLQQHHSSKAFFRTKGWPVSGQPFFLATRLLPG
jgi:hypothetical protein